MKILLIIMAFCLLLSCSETPPAAPVQSFDDVPPDHWAYEEIELIYSYGITVGCSYDPPLYCPERALTRAEVAVMLARVLAIIESER